MHQQPDICTLKQCKSFPEKYILISQIQALLNIAFSFNFHLKNSWELWIRCNQKEIFTKQFYYNPYSESLGILIEHNEILMIFIFLDEYPELQDSTLKCFLSLTDFLLLFTWLYKCANHTIRETLKLNYDSTTRVQLSQETQIRQYGGAYQNLQLGESGGWFCVFTFGRNLASVTVKMFSLNH